MALSIEHPEADRLARELADEIIAISDHCASLPVLDDRTPEEILGYDEKGAPG